MKRTSEIHEKVLCIDAALAFIPQCTLERGSLVGRRGADNGVEVIRGLCAGGWQGR